ncbi:ABC transporter permease [Corynebacterium sp. CCM 8835]|uniref:ABC transporter permease n=1 Tax=Corynebacterium antarcticum TaxID=2800405 RepID=A0ABS1FL86_9CORY|nr:ABC transporter permease [Corynebacterium antarcticum]MCK7642560.1 ABC transporter permease [Corynebacterium antarcticum]MCK7660755.1 ABC transporter permease [Corynebacterium antarcticum]MCL0245501.1 ABC transporter permease [Corynebacterium antarcticum]MCX7540072.1 ABC transporter permease [Corynebacterium antarcticum]
MPACRAQRTWAARVFIVSDSHSTKDLSGDIARLVRAEDPGECRSRSTTFAAAWSDLVRGFLQHELWLQLGWQDIKQRYRRSVLGPLWITIATGVMAVALGLLYSVLFRIPVAEFLPHVTVGLIMWNFISGAIKDGSDIFIENEGLIKQLPSALSVHVYRLVWRQLLFLAHNMVIWLVLMMVFPRPLGMEGFLAIPALFLLVLNGVWVSMFFGIIATRYRDVSPLLEALVQLLFYITPIVWTTTTLKDQGGEISERAKLAQLNPLYHYMEVLRAPLIGADLPVYHWWVVIGCTAAGLCLALLAMKQWRFRVSYWV